MEPNDDEMLENENLIYLFTFNVFYLVSYFLSAPFNFGFMSFQIIELILKMALPRLL